MGNYTQQTRQGFRKILSLLLTIFLLVSVMPNLAAIDTEEKAERTSILLDEFVRTLPVVTADDNGRLRVIVRVAEASNIETVKQEVLKIADTEIVYQYRDILRGFSLEINKSDLAQLFAIDGVENVDYSHRLIESTVNAKELTNVVKAVAEYKEKFSGKPNLDGRGMVIASLDSGVDVYSDDLQLDKGDTDSGVDQEVFDSLKIKETTFTRENGKPNYKIPYAFNYFRGDQTPLGLKDKVARPHGMHIAGILAGNSGEKDRGFKGIAPNAQLIVYKVITDDRKKDIDNDWVEYLGEDSAFFAMDDAIARGADIISLSIGNQGSGSKSDIWNSAVEKAYQKGVVVVAAMGNWASSNSQSSYDSFADADIDIKDNSTTVSVAANTGAIGVGSTYNAKLSLPKISIDNENVVVYYQNIGKENEKYLQQINYQATAEIVYVDKGMSDKYLVEKDFSDIKGKIVIVKRGGEAMKDKIQRFLNNGAIGVILMNAATDDWRANNDIYPVFGYNHLTITKGFAVGISGNDAKKIMEYTEKNPKAVTLQFSPEPESVKFYEKTGLSGFSSWGPNHDLEIKPDVVAPGENILSLANENQYTIMSGTSMAQPHAAGIATLILQSLKDKDQAFFDSLNINKVDYVKALLMNTANVLKDNEMAADEDVHEYATRRQGAGLVDLSKALTSDVLITYNKTKGGVSLKEIKADQKEFTVELHNFGDKTRSFFIKDSGVLHEVTVKRVRQNETTSYEADTLHMGVLAGASLTGPGQVSIPPKDTVKLTFTLDVATANNEFVEGYIYFVSQDDEQPDLNIPFMGFKGNWIKEDIFDKPAWEKDSKAKLTYLYRIVAGHHDDENEYQQIGRPGNKLLGKENEELQIDPMMYAMNNVYKKTNTTITEVVPNVIFLRDVDTYEVAIVPEPTAEAEPIKVLDIAHHPNKYIHNLNLENNRDYTIPIEAAKWKGRAYNPANGEEKKVLEGQYYFRYKAKLQKDDTEYQYLYMPIKVDNTDPTIERVEYDKTESVVKIHTSDNMGIWKVAAGIDGVTQEVLKAGENEYIIKNVKVNQISKTALHIEVMDIAGNQAEKYDEELNKAPEIWIDNLSRVLAGTDKKIKLSCPNDVTMTIKNTQGETVSVEEEADDDRKIVKFDISNLNDDKTFTAEWTKDGTSYKESFVLELIPHKREEKDPYIPPVGKFTAQDTSLSPGMFFNYNHITGANNDGDTYIEYDYENGTGKLSNLKMYFVLHLQENQRAVVTNVNVDYSRANDMSNEPMDTWEASGNDDYEPVIKIASGNNIINLKVYDTDEETSEESLVYNKGFLAYIDSELPSLVLNESNIVYNPEYLNPTDDFDEDVVGNIYTKDGTINLQGDFFDDLDGVVVKVNDNVVERVNLPGETGYGKGKFATTVHARNEEILKLEAIDNYANSKIMRFKVIVDDVAPELTVEALGGGEIGSDSVLQIRTTEKTDEDFGDNLVETKVYVNGKTYEPGTELSDYMVDGEEKFLIVAVATDKAGNRTEKTVNVGDVTSELAENIAPKKEEFSIEELEDLANVIDIPADVTAKIVDKKIDTDANQAVLTVELTDKHGFTKTYPLSLKLAEKQYQEDPNLTLELKKNEFSQDEEISILSLFGDDIDVGVMIMDKIDLASAGEKTLRVRLYKGDKYRDVEYKLMITVSRLTVNYDTDGGSNIDSETLDKGTVINLADKVPVKAGFKFAGWYKDKAYKFKIDKLELLENTTIYAKWENPNQNSGGNGGGAGGFFNPNLQIGYDYDLSPAENMAGNVVGNLTENMSGINEAGALKVASKMDNVPKTGERSLTAVYILLLGLALTVIGLEAGKAKKYVGKS